MKDMHSAMTASVAIAAAVYTADQTGATIQRTGYESLEFVLSMGVGGITFTGANKIEMVIEHSDDGSAWSAVADGDVLGATVGAGGIVKTFDAAHVAGAQYRFGYKGAKHYARMNADFSGTHGTGTPLAVTALLINGHSNPQADQN